MSHIVIDARFLYTSTGRYVERLIEHLAPLDTANHYTILLLKKDFERYQPPAANFTKLCADFAPYTLSEQVGLARLLYHLKPDLVHFGMPQQPLLWFGPRVTTIHDLTLINFINRQPGNPLKTFYKYTLKPLVFRIALRQIVKRSRHVITPTDYVRNQVIQQFGIKPERVTRTYESVDQLAPKPEPIPALKGMEFIFFVGNAFPYKNLRRLIDAAPHLPEPVQLVLAGKKDYFYEELEAYAKERGITNVHFTGFVTDAELAWMHHHAKMYVIASLSEGFSLTGVEAMYYGLPVAASTATCLPEVHGDAAVYFDPLDPADIARVLSTTLQDPKKLAELKAAGLKQVKKYSWDTMAEQTLEVYNRALHTK